jgi:hypothetical protein
MIRMKLHVQCYSGSKADERPVRFRLDDREYLVEEILDQWYGPEHIFFKLRADDSNFYILRTAPLYLTENGSSFHFGRQDLPSC